MASKWDTDRIVGICAMVVSVATLAALSYQAYLTRQAERRSVLPYMYIALASNDHGTAVMLENTGIGPALIESIHVHDKSRDITGDAYDFYVAVHPDAPAKGLGVDRVQPGRLVPAGANVLMVQDTGVGEKSILKEMLTLFDFVDAPDTWYAGAKITRKDRAVIEVVYTSVYGERWRIRSDRVVPEHL